MGKGTHHVNWKDQLCYKCRIIEINNVAVFHICCGKFNIEEAPSTNFECEIFFMTVVTATQDLEREQTTALNESVADVAPNVNIGLLQEIAELRHQGINLDDDNEPAHENAHSSAPATQTIGQWLTPTICPRRADMN